MLNTTSTNSTQNTTSQASLIDNSDMSFVLVSSFLVMLMTPALGFFYGGLVKTHKMVSMLGQCLLIYSLTAIAWTVLGFSLVYSDTTNWGMIGSLSNAFLNNVGYLPNPAISRTIPFFLFFFFQMQMACICPALILGATAEKIRWKPMYIFCLLWHILVYCPIAHWNWNANGWLRLLGTKDFAGGNVIHLTAGMSAMALVIYLENEPIKKIKYSNQGFLRRREESTQFTDILELAEKEE